MSELFNRLRQLGNTMAGASGGYLCLEAADEGERLQEIEAEYNACRDAVVAAASRDSTTVEFLRGRIVWLENVIESLQSRLHEATKAGTVYAADRDARNVMVVENQRLETVVDLQAKALAACKRELLLYAGDAEDHDDGTAEALSLCGAAEQARKS